MESLITLDGSRSVDLDGTIDLYRWALVTGPAESVATIEDVWSAVTTFTPDLPGVYTFELEIGDSSGYIDRSYVVYTVLPALLTVDAGTDLTVEWRKTAQLDGRAIADYAETPTLTWSFVSKPAHSVAVLQDATMSTPSFTADAAGEYVLQLTATTSQHTGSDTVTVVAAPHTIPFDGAFIDAEFQHGVGRLIAISDGPPRVRFIDAETGSETSLPLASTPTTLAIDHNEHSLAVGTTGKVLVFDLFSTTLSNSFDVPFTPSHMVFGPFQRVHCFTSDTGPIQTLDATTGLVSAGPSVPGGTIAEQRYSDSYMYAIETTSTLADLTRYYIGSAAAEYEGASPDAGQYPLGDKLWVFNDLMVVRGGGVFETHPFVANDMVYRGRLDGDEPATPAWVMSIGPQLLTLHAMTAPAPPNDQFRIYDRTSLSLLESLPLPYIVVNGVAQRSTGRLIGYSPSFPGKVVIVASAGTSNAFFVTEP